MKLTQEEKRIKLAEACGKCLHSEIKKWEHEDGNDYEWGYTCVKCGKDPHDRAQTVPDYFNDLNAMHEAENICISPADGPTKRLYSENLSWCATLGGTSSECATAAQRAESLGQTLNLWEAGA